MDRVCGFGDLWWKVKMFDGLGVVNLRMQVVGGIWFWYQMLDVFLDRILDNWFKILWPWCQQEAILKPVSESFQMVSCLWRSLHQSTPTSPLSDGLMTSSFWRCCTWVNYIILWWGWKRSWSLRHTLRNTAHRPFCDVKVTGLSTQIWHGIFQWSWRSWFLWRQAGENIFITMLLYFDSNHSAINLCIVFP